MNNTQRKQWMGKVPTKCDISQKPITDTFIDGATQMGPWACMLPDIHARYGRGLGTGRGQKYQLDATDGKWYKVEG